jgi:hypothetical protein
MVCVNLPFLCSEGLPVVRILQQDNPFVADRSYKVEYIQSTWLNRVLSLLVYTCIYGAACKARNFKVVYVWTCVWQRWKPPSPISAQCFNTESMQKVILWHSCV